MDALCKCMFIIETIVNIEHEDETCFKGHRCFSKNLFMSIRHMKKEQINTRFPLLLFLCTEQFTDTNMFRFLHTAQHTSSEHAKYTFIIYYYICLSLCAHFDEAKFSIKLVYFTVSVVKQRNEYEIVTETRPIKTQPALISKKLICTKILIIAPSSDEIKYT